MKPLLCRKKPEKAGKPASWAHTVEVTVEAASPGKISPDVQTPEKNIAEDSHIASPKAHSER
jgi:hypothetical protein